MRRPRGTWRPSARGTGRAHDAGTRRGPWGPPACGLAAAPMRPVWRTSLATGERGPVGRPAAHDRDGRRADPEDARRLRVLGAVADRKGLRGVHPVSLALGL